MDQEKVAFDDVLLQPQYSDIYTRSDIDLLTVLGDFFFELPIISSPMDTVTEEAMALSMYRAGGLGIIHRYNSIPEQADLVQAACQLGASHIGAAVGITGDYLERAQALVAAGANFICIDAAHGHHISMKKALLSLRQELGFSIHLMAGNVATARGFQALVDWGADSIRVGIGGGSICTTRIQTGHGVPTLQSIIDCAKLARDTGVQLIADGGIKNSGDIVKALAAGANFVMLGSLLAGTEQSPGDVITAKDGNRFKKYRGMASYEAQSDYKGPSHHVEGVSSQVPFKGPVEEVIKDLMAGVRSGLSYSGARNTLELQTSCVFIRQSSSSVRESSPHIFLDYGIKK
jgi:IMP dehydrogenase